MAKNVVKIQLSKNRVIETFLVAMMEQGVFEYAMFFSVKELSGLSMEDRVRYCKIDILREYPSEERDKYTVKTCLFDGGAVLAIVSKLVGELSDEKPKYQHGIDSRGKRSTGMRKRS